MLRVGTYEYSFGNGSSATVHVSHDRTVSEITPKLVALFRERGSDAKSVSPYAEVTAKKECAPSIQAQCANV